MTRHGPKQLAALLALVVSLALLAAGCGDGDTGQPAGTPPSVITTTTAADASISGEITVSAAASLTEAFTELGADFRAAHPDATVTFTFDSSGTLATQILAGAPVDVFASADEANMTKVVEAGLVDGAPADIARNRLVIVTKRGNPAGIDSLADLVDVGVVSLCSEQAPCGKLAATALEKAGVQIPESSVTRGQNVKATLTAVGEGDAVAGIVYVTDATAAGDSIEAVDIPEDQNAVAVYPIGVLSSAPDVAVARAFVDHVRSEAGRRVLEEHGFLPPE